MPWAFWMMVMGRFLNLASGAEESKPPPLEKIAALLPETPGRGGLRCVSAESVRGGVELLCELTYPDLQGQPTTGQAKLFLPSRLLEEPTARLPLLHVAGYELDRGGGEGFLAQGIVVSTPHGEPLNPLVRGENLDVAILHRMRAQPWVDDARVQIVGGSAGGYMALLLAAETFPLEGCAADVPPVNLAYNMAYFHHNQALAAAQPEGQDHLNMPVLHVVCPLGEQMSSLYGTDHESDAWLAISPICRMDEVTCPTLVTCSTADLLVPIDQFGEELVRPFDPALFPQGFEMARERLLARPASRRTLLEVLPEQKREVITIPVPATAPRIGWEGTAGPEPAVTVEVPFSREKPFTLAVLDEGPPEPQCAHTKHAVAASKEAFLRHCRESPVAASQLLEPKLVRLMRRYLYREAHPAIVFPAQAPAPFVAHRLDFPELERADVLRGLRTFAADPAGARQLLEVYRALPAELQALGADFAEGGPEALQARLEALVQECSPH